MNHKERYHHNGRCYEPLPHGNSVPEAQCPYTATSIVLKDAWVIRAWEITPPRWPFDIDRCKVTMNTTTGSIDLTLPVEFGNKLLEWPYYDVEIKLTPRK